MQNLEKLNFKELQEKWRKDLKCEPPERTSKEFLCGHIAWNNQAAKEGGLKRKTNNQIKQLLIQLREGKDLTPDHNLNIKQGTRFIRQFKGRKYEVIAVEDGFLYEGKKFKSLSAVAQEITGTSWNGKVFFGAKRQKR